MSRVAPLRWFRFACIALLVLALSHEARAQVVLNEVLASNRVTNFDDDRESSDWVELLNPTGELVSLDGWSLSDDPRGSRRWELPAVDLAPGERRLVWCSGKDRVQVAPGADDAVISPDVLAFGAEWRYLSDAPTGVVPEGWYLPEFDDRLWARGTAPIGVGEAFLGTSLPPGIGAIFLRRRVVVTSPEELSALWLDAIYDDGFVLWVNGERILRVNFAEDAEPGFGSVASRREEWSDPRRIPLDSLPLVPGENVIAVAVLNFRATDVDTFFDAQIGTLPPVLHADFELAREGEALILFDARGAISDAVSYPPQDTDRSWGRLPDGTGGFVYLLDPTPLSANGGPWSAERIANSVGFDPDHQSAEPFDLRLSVELPLEGVTIRVRTDGREPTSTDTVYSAPMRIERDTVVRARAFVGDLPITQSTTRTYFGLSTRTRDLALPVLSLGLSPVDFQFVHMSTEARGITAERAASLEYWNEDGGLEFDTDIGFRLHGGLGRFGPLSQKKPYRVYFRSRYGVGRLRYPLFSTTAVDEFDKLVLRSNVTDSFVHGAEAGYIRDQVVRDLHREMGQPASHGTWANLLINGEHRGVYNIVERMDKEFFASHFPEIGDDWDVIKTGSEALDGTLEEFTRMLGFLRTADLSRDDLYQRALELVDVENFTAYMVLNIWAQNHDWPGNNWYAARPRRPEGRWIFLCWDAEFGLARIPPGWSEDSFSVAVNGGEAPASIVLAALLRSPDYQRYFLQELDRHLAGALSPETVIEIVDRLAAIIAPDMPEEAALHRVVTTQWERNVESIREFARHRGAAIRGHVLTSPIFGLPRVVSVSPRSVSLGAEPTVVALRGSSFTRDTEVFFAGVPSPAVEFESSRSLRAVVPFDPRVEGSPSITVKDPLRGETTSSDLLTVTFARPRLLVVQPRVGAAGDSVILLGERFEPGVGVEFGGVPSSSVVRVEESDTVLTVLVPPGAETVDVHVINPGGRSSVEEVTFTYSEASSYPFVRGDANRDGDRGIADAVMILGYLTGRPPAPPVCLDAFDVDDSGHIDLTDPIYLLRRLFLAGPAVPAPDAACGADPSLDELPCRAASACP